MRRLINLESSLKLKSDAAIQKRKGWKLKEILCIIAAVFTAVSIPVLMAVFLYNYASLYQSGEMGGARESVNEETMIQEGY